MSEKADPLVKFLEGLKASSQLTPEQLLSEFYKSDENLPMKSRVKDVAGLNVLAVFIAYLEDKKRFKLARLYKVLYSAQLMHSVSAGGGRDEMVKVLSSLTALFAASGGQILNSERSNKDKLLGR